MIEVPDILPVPEFPETIKEITTKLCSAGGKPYLVGGATIDIITGKEPKDWDIEVFNMSYQNIIDQLETIPGIKLDLIGSKFGIVKIKNSNIDVELAVPRTENTTGPKHQDFDISLKPNLSIKEAAKRRDFTINCIYLNLETKEYIDPYNGIDHLKSGSLRYVDKDTFVEDPLRAFRAIQLVARKGKAWHMSLVLLINSMLPSLKEVPGEAIFGELNKCLMLAERPSIGIRRLGLPTNPNRGMIELFPELKGLVGCKQKEEWHPEGDAWAHTLLVIDEAAYWRHEIPTEWQLAFMYGMLLHDVGKPLALDPETLSTIGHDKMGEPLARSFMERLTNNEDLINKVCSIVKVHMRPRLLLKSSPRRATWRRLQNECRLDILAYVSMVDNDGRGKGTDVLGKTETSFVRTMEVYRELGKPSAEIKPILMGRHLIAAGYKPSPQFGPMLAKAYEYQLETGCEDIEELLSVARN